MTLMRIASSCFYLLLILSALSISSPGYADIISTSGAVTQIAPPASVEAGALESDTLVPVFQEQTNLTLTSDLTVNITDPGTYVGPIDPSNTVSSGSIVESYLFHMDVVGGAGAPSVNYVGSVTFGTDILGIITSEAKLDATGIRFLVWQRSSIQPVLPMTTAARLIHPAGLIPSHFPPTVERFRLICFMATTISNNFA